MKNITFEDFLMEKHAEQYVGIKDTMIDDYERWTSELDVQELIDFADEAIEYYKNQLIKELRSN